MDKKVEIKRMNYQLKTVKFGGSSLSDGHHFMQVKDIIESDNTRRYVVPSAPGKRNTNDYKITDMLFKCYEKAYNGESIESLFKKITDRYDRIIDELHIDLDLKDEYDKIKSSIQNNAGRDYAASRGEYINAIIISKLLNFHFLDSARVVKFDESGKFDLELTTKLMSNKLSQHKHAVIPGFYGSMPNGTIKTFSRGGSDITGSIVARASKSELYENWTDVSGFLMADPRIVNDPELINTITYRELRELSYMGAGVLHEDAIFPVRSAGIPINIRNTNDPSCKGTMIVPETQYKDGDNVVTGIAGKKGFSVITIDKDMMNSELGFGRRILKIIEDEGLPFEHLPSGIDTMCVILSTDLLKGKKIDIKKKIEDECKPDYVGIDDGLSLIAVVGRNMVRTKGTAARVFSAISRADINVKMIDQGSSEISIIVGVNETDFEKTIRCLYDEFNK